MPAVSLPADYLPLLRAVPASVRADAAEAASVLPPANLRPSSRLIQDTNVKNYPAIRVTGELVQIPYRIYSGWPAPERMASLSTTARLVLACWMSRHADGRVRHRVLPELLAAEVDWAAPYAVQLCGEYVLEIGQDVLQFVTDDLAARPRTRDRYARFARENPDFIQLTRRRAASYWNAYHRGRMELREYPPALAVARLMEFSSAEPAR